MWVLPKLLGMSSRSHLSHSSGVLLHLTSLPGGKLGPGAYAFVDWLVAAGQSWWQMLPVGPPDRNGSPYTPQSVFAGWPGLLAEPDAPVTEGEIAAFRERERYWIGGWERFAGPGAVADQVRFEREWRALREYASARGVFLFGDLPIYVAPNRADQRSHPEAFLSGVVAGAPPDSLSASGQLWRNPLYDWPELQRHGYRWWIERLRRSLALFDLVRLDHFRGFVSFWEVPAGDRTARYGHWHRGPGAAVFHAAERELGPLPLVAEDLGVITAAVERLREELGYPGMLVLQFQLDPGRANPHVPENHVANAVVYTGTHDMDTALGWFRSLSSAQQAATGYDPADPSWDMIRAALASRAVLSIVPAQDLLGLGSEARMNFPGKTKGNWSWRLEPGALTPELAERLRVETDAAGRLRSRPDRARPRARRSPSS
jgi:4-alpha-glucanotransferase